MVISGTPKDNGYAAGIQVNADTVYLCIYEKTSTDSEATAGRIGMQGTAANQVKLWTTGSRAAGVFELSRRWQGRDSDDEYDSEYSYEGKPVNFLIGGDFAYEAEMITTNVTVYGGDLEPETATGKLRNFTGEGPIVARSLETKTFGTASTHHRCRVQNLIGLGPQMIWKTENFTTASSGTTAGTVVTNVAYLSYLPVNIEYVEATAGGTPGSKGLITVGTVGEYEAKLDRASKTVTFHANDGVTGATVRYAYLV